MSLDAKLHSVAVVGAAGKMGRSISLLLAQEMALQKLEHPDKNFALHLVDPNEAALEGLWHYIRNQTVRTAEKQIIKLRTFVQGDNKLCENQQIIDHFVYTALSIVRLSTELEVVRKSLLVFEAAIEEEELKAKIFQNLQELCPSETLFFTNTSSIPIHALEEKANLQGRLIGYHFYNPPAVQKLLELIPSKQTPAEFTDLAGELATRLRKKVVLANDIAGFIGNGHFIRDGLHAFSEVRRLQEQHGIAAAVYIVNKVSQDLLLRPMGIFQLIDYVGIDVFQCIQRIMSKYLPEDYGDSLIEEMVAANVFGGQHSDSSQKDGFLKYAKNRIIGVYDLNTKTYIEDEQWSKELDQKIGDYPKDFSPWKTLLTSKDKNAKLEQHFTRLKSMETLGSKLAIAYLQKSKTTAENLVRDGVANSAEDVNTVLTTGFFHLYGPVNNYL